jgi:hypothetical protein
MLLPSENGDGEGKTVKGGLGSAFVADGERMGGGCTEVATRPEKEGGGVRRSDKQAAPWPTTA